MTDRSSHQLIEESSSVEKRRTKIKGILKQPKNYALEGESSSKGKSVTFEFDTKFQDPSILNTTMNK